MLSRQYVFGLWIALKVIGCNFLLPAEAWSQVVSDGTTATSLSGSCLSICTVTGGVTDLTGANLFHSFEQFSVPTNGSVIFEYDPNIRNVLARVTGNNSSIIDGLIRDENIVDANIFLINPNGISIGPNGGLDIGGSFVATTANAIQFGTQGEFSTSDIASDIALLTISPSAFLFDQITPQPIVSQSVAPNPLFPSFIIDGLQVQPGKSLLLIGGDVMLRTPAMNSEVGLASFQPAPLRAPSGRIELGGLDAPGVVGLDVIGSNLSLRYEDTSSLANVSIAGSLLDVSGNFDNPASSVVINANTLSVSDSVISSRAFGAENAGDIFIQANSAVQIDNGSVISGTFSSGEGGNIEILTRVLSLENDSSLSVNTRGTGDAGKLLLDAETISINARSNLISTAESFSGVVGSTGEIQIQTDTLFLNNDSKISAATTGETVNVEPLVSLRIEARESVSLVDESSILSETFGEQNASDIEIYTETLSVDNSSISAAVNGEDALNLNSNATGRGGDISINTRLLLLENNAQLASNTSGEGDAGSIFVQDAELVSLSGSSVSTGTSTSGEGGNIEISAEQITLESRALVSARSTGLGPAGDVILQSTGQFRVQDEARIEVSGDSIGNSGSLEVVAETAVLDDGQLLASTQAGEDGNIRLQIEDALVLRGESLISAEAFNDADGGNVDIATPFIIALFPDGPNGSDIQASAIDGDGGRISIQANTLFNIAENLAIDGNMTNDLDASSGTGIDGEVVIETLEIDPTQGTATLPTDPANPKIAQGCQASGGGNGEFINSGRRGIPPNPYEPLSGDGIQEDIYPAGQTLAQPSTNQRLAGASENTSETLIEAQGWSRNLQGDIVLLAESSESLSFCQRTSTGAS